MADLESVGRRFESCYPDQLEKVNVMDREQLKYQAIFRLVAFFAIAIVVGFIASDVNILMSQ